MRFVLNLKYVSIFIGVLFLAVAFQYFEEDAAEFNKARNVSSEKYLNSDLGSTRYQVYGDSNKEVIILIAASNGYLEQWNPNIEPLVKAGYKVVVYDLFGRGLSDKPKVNLDLSVFRGQLNSIIDEVGSKRVHLIGSSFGSIIASDYAINNKMRIDKIIFVGPAGWPSNINSASRLLNIPILGELIFHYFGETILRPRVEGYFHAKEGNVWAIDKWQEFADYPGFMRSYLSTLRHSPVIDYTNGWENFGKLNKSALFIWGKDDISFPFENSKKAIELIPSAKIIGIDRAAHWVNIEKPLQVNNAIISFLEK
jgi:pimeloyl-ACP methyl ester carboxylesterase